MRDPIGDPNGFAELIAAARRQSLCGTTVIAFADSRYLDVLMNWLVALDAIGIEGYLVVALDRELYGFLLERRIPAVLSEVRGDLSTLWIRRIRIFAALCEAGVDFVHSDADAVWLRDPRAAYLDNQDADLIISQGTVWPPDVHSQFGFVMCCGLFQMRSSPRTQGLLKDLRHHVTMTGDDQISLNRLIAARAARWQIEPGSAYYTEVGGKRFLCSRLVMHGLCSDGLRVAVLPHHLFARVAVSSIETPHVVHLLTPKEPNAKLAEFAKHGCLMLRADWRTIDFDSSSLARLKRRG